MEMILAILLYLQLLISPGTYTQTHIDQLQISHQPEITAVQADPEQMAIVNSVYLPQTQHIIVINDQHKD